MTVQDIIQAISTLLDFELVEETEEKAVFKVISDHTAELNKSFVNDVISSLAYYNSNEEVELYNSKSYEVLVRNESRVLMRRELEQDDTVNKLHYKLDKPTTNYLIFFLYNLYKQDAPNFLRRGIMGHRLRRIFERRESEQQQLFDDDILELIKDIIPRLETIQISSESNKKLEEFENLLFAFIFNLGYNLDLNMQPLRFMAEFIQPYRMASVRRTRTSDVEPPKRLYINDIILHYQKSISSESLDHQYLSFYHVIEHFFEKIYNDDILNRIRVELTKPSFSYKRTKDVKSLVNIIQNKLKYKNEEFSINEVEALELTLTKFIIDINDFKTSLNEFSYDLIEYFKTTEVGFSTGNKVNFDSTNEEEIFKNLSKRIYKTRNSIVHSKETEKTKYIPFKDDKELVNEIYLLRLIAEYVIIESSREL